MADDAELEAFVHEVRRRYAFLPMVGGRVLQAFDWHGVRFRPGTWFLLDLYGTNHDPALWDEPEAFRPERFHGRAPSPYDLVPQGGGDGYETTHRCAGEVVAVELLKHAVRLLTSAMQYEVPAQDLSVDLTRMPAIPASRFLIGSVRPTTP